MPALPRRRFPRIRLPHLLRSGRRLRRAIRSLRALQRRSRSADRGSPHL